MTTTTTPAPVALNEASLNSILEKFGTSLTASILGEVEKKFAALKPGDETPKQPTPAELQKQGAERLSQLNALAFGAGIKDHEKVGKQWFDAGFTIEHAQLAVQSLMVGGNPLSKDSGQGDADPDAVYKAEYQKSIAAFSSMGLSLQEYITSRKIDDKSEVLAAKVA